MPTTPHWPTSWNELAARRNAKAAYVRCPAAPRGRQRAHALRPAPLGQEAPRYLPLAEAGAGSHCN
ncbi:MAG: hypothetical protein ACK5S1_01560, partial [bacterium]